MRYRITAAFLSVLVLVALSAPVLAQSRPGIDEFIRRANAVIAAQNPAGPPLPASDPRVQALLASASGKSVFGQGPDTAQDLDRLTLLRQTLGKLVRPYVLEGIAPGATDMQAAIAANIRKYEAVLAPLSALAMDGGAHALSAMSAHTGSLAKGGRESVMKDIRELRQAEIQMYTGFLTMMPMYEDGPHAMHVAMLAAASDSAPAVAGALTVPQRRDMYFKIVRAAAFSKPDEAARFESIKQAFDGKECVGLCAFGE
jgi:hypothetical protein